MKNYFGDYEKMMFEPEFSICIEMNTLLFEATAAFRLKGRRRYSTLSGDHEVFLTAGYTYDSVGFRRVSCIYVHFSLHFELLQYS